jgi:Zn finger protein HypA/HybF involved in hydrogenase expression
MHDFLLAKQIIEEITRIAKEKNLDNIKTVNIEIGSVVLAHDGLNEHAEDINLDNLRFGLESISPKYGLEKAKFEIVKAEGESWKITNIEVK